MKAAISIPDPLFDSAEALAKRLDMSRSELFRHALEKYIEAHKQDRVRDTLDTVYVKETSRVDDTLAEMQWASLPQEDW